MGFVDGLGVIACRCVIFDGKHVHFVSHAGGDWQMYCRDTNHDFTDDCAMGRDLALVNVCHLVERDNSLNVVSDLAVDMGAERASLADPWVRFHNAD